MTCFNRKIPAFLLAGLLFLAACGDFTTPTAVPAPTPTAKTLPTSGPTSDTTATPEAKFTPVATIAKPTSTPKKNLEAAPGWVIPTSDGARWRLLQPDTPLNGALTGMPMEAKGNNGTLWIKYPAFKKEAEAGWPDWPLGDYEINYRPANSNTDEVLKTFPAVAEPSDPPCQNCQLYNYVNMIAAVASNHFLVEVGMRATNAQNGGKIQLWWLEPDTQTVKLVLTGPEIGGGRFSAETHNIDWLFFNQWRTALNPEPFATDDAQAFVVNLLTGEKTEVKLGDENVANQPNWQFDNKLYFTVKDTNGKLNSRVLDPQTGAVS